MNIGITSDRGAISMTDRRSKAPTASRADRSPEARSGLPTMLRSLVRSARGPWLEGKRQMAERAQLVELLSADDHLLTDIGLCRHDVETMIRQHDVGRTYALRSRITTSTRATVMPSGT